MLVVVDVADIFLTFFLYTSMRKTIYSRGASGKGRENPTAASENTEHPDRRIPAEGSSLQLFSDVEVERLRMSVGSDW